ncbi:MAG TPA: RbsD/FucU family protein [Tepidisphaeraceae bacterium]|nr:RbsD/FucU family protein [Tepidisphaeraceae bacterium]
MLKTQLLHPQVLSALGKAGHNSRVLIADANFPHWTKRGPNAEVVFLNFSPGLIDAVEILKVLTTAIPVESAVLMDTNKSGPHAMATDPPIWTEFRRVLSEAGCTADLKKLSPTEFYAAAGSPDVALIIASGEERIYANLLLTIGVVLPR